MDSTAVGFNWLSSGGAYALLAFIWIGAAVGFGNYGYRLGRRFDSPNDGCLLTAATQVLVLIGGSAGFLVSGFPWYLLTSAIGAVTFPGLACLYFAWRMRKWMAGQK